MTGFGQIWRIMPSNVSPLLRVVRARPNDHFKGFDYEWDENLFSRFDRVIPAISWTRIAEGYLFRRRR